MKTTTSTNKKRTNKSSLSETGHVKNVANFQTEIAFCIGYGADYNPVNPLLEIIKLESKFDSGKNTLKTVKDTKEPYDSQVGIRQTLFKPLRPLTTKVYNALIAANAPETVIKDARTIIRKLTGKRAGGTTGDTGQNKISVSQQSFDRLIDHFEELIVLAQTEGKYNPNETELKIDTLKTVLDALTASNKAVKDAYVPYSRAMIKRDKELYDAENGLVTIALEIKNYIKSVFGATSPEYKQLSRLKFTRPKSK